MAENNCRIVGLTGLHGTGKSHLARLFADLFNWNCLHKRTWLKNLYDESPLNQRTTANWDRWLYQLYDELGPSAVMEMILSAHKSTTGVLVFDSIHNPEEWRAVTAVDPNAVLVGVFAPLTTRIERRTADGVRLDSRRVKYWHQGQGKESPCLLTKVEWAFTGHCSRELQIAECESFSQYLNRT
jgi:chloramphenicol 3-O-phosphotransferase